jgi:5-methylcytosine-specific restriction protein B
MVRQFLSIQEALREYDRESKKDALEVAEEERQEIVRRFPLDDWPAMTLEQYALGLDDSSDTYCYWLEFGSPHMCSMRGGSSVKHLVYKHKNKPGWYFSSEYQDEQEAWLDIRAALVQAFELAGAGEWERIDELQPIRGGRALRLKTLYVYYPDQIMPITSVYHIQHFLERLGMLTDEMKRWEAVRLNRGLLHALREIPDMEGWTTDEMGKFLYEWAHPREARRVVKIAPGHDAKYWQDCLDHGYICLGWDDIGDLREFDNWTSFRDRFHEVFFDKHKGHKSTLTAKAREVWTLMQLEPRDIVVANQGVSRILAAGEVVEPVYQWRPDRSTYRHTVHVKWDTSYAQEIPPQNRWGMVTVADVPLELYQQILSKGSGDEQGPKETLPTDPLFLHIADALERKGQLILYGPPGTGKTYHARRFSVWWLLRHLEEGDPMAVLGSARSMKEAERRLSTAQVARRLWWMVANPKEWSWDQAFSDGQVTFRYGRLKRNYPLVQPGDLVVGYQSTPDKRIVAVARVTKGIYESNDDEPGIELEPVHRIRDGLTYSELQADSTLKDSEPMRFRCQGTLFALTADEAEYLLALLTERDPGLSELALAEESVGPLTWVTFHPSCSYEDFIEGFRPVDKGSGGLVLRLADGLFKRVCREAQAHAKRRYLLVVDEINRANIAKVFGELITLLEKDKRGMQVRLPQSRERFTIPPNVFLLGTMNTADRSIKLLDAALRRRFAFMEIMPDVSLLSGAVIGDLELDAFLDALNRRIAASEGREKQIGHSFLLDDAQPVGEPEEFARRFRQEILPLLQEYCYDDYAALATYLGNTLVDGQAQALNQDILNDADRLVDALAQLINEEESLT